MKKKPRRHHLQLVKRGYDIANGKIPDKKTVVETTPGGGKTLAAAAFAKVLLDAGIVDRVCWVCPRCGLATQTSEAFIDEEHNPTYKARRADNTPPLIRDAGLGCVAYTTTYHAVAARPGVHQEEFERHRYLLILDEPHHLADEEGRTWVSSIALLVERAAHVLLMTGTIERHDGLPIPFIEYTKVNGRLFPVAHIRYDLREAIIEQAVLEIRFTYQDGWAEFLHKGIVKNVEISRATDDEASKVIATFLGQTSYREKILRRGIEHWLLWTANVYPSRAIVICANQRMAREVKEFLQDVYKLQVALAISDDPDSQRTIRKFRKGERGRVLVTVGMAYEGLDVPDCSHLICLTSTRSIPWLEQAFARVTRPDYKAIEAGIGYDRQFGWIFVPDDPPMRKTVDHIRQQQHQGLRDRKQVPVNEPSRKGAPSDFVPLGAVDGAVGHGTIDGRLSPDESELVDLAIQKRPRLAQLPPEEIVGLLKDHGLRPARVVRPKSGIPEEDEGSLRKKIQAVCTARDQTLKLPYGTSNRSVKYHFGKSREQMGLSELRACLEWVVSLDAEEIAAG